MLFTDDITSDRLSYFQSGDDLLVRIDGSNENMVTIKDWFLGGEHEVAYIQPAGAYGIPAAQINTMVQQEPAPASASMGTSGYSALGETATEDTFSGIEMTYGTNHNDILRGNTESNALIGLNGNDELFGGLGNDYLEGGEGNDTFVFNTALDGDQNVDSIADFESGKDTLKLHNSIFDTLQAEGILSEANFHASETGLAADDDDYILYNTGTGTLSYDLDGRGRGVAVEFAKLTSKPELQNKDIFIAA